MRPNGTRKAILDALEHRSELLQLKSRERALIVNCDEWNADLASDLRSLKLDCWALEEELKVLRRVAAKQGRERREQTTYTIGGEQRFGLRDGEIRLSVVPSRITTTAASDGFTFTGYAAKFDSPSEDLGGFREYIKRGAFAKSIQRGDDVRLLINHDGMPLARTISGTLQLREDSIGLLAVAQLDPEDPDVQRLRPKMKRGDISQMSFGFKTVADKWYVKNGEDSRDLIAADLHDVSVVTFPAYPATSATLRKQLPPAQARWQAEYDARARALKLLAIR